MKYKENLRKSKKRTKGIKLKYKVKVGNIVDDRNGHIMTILLSWGTKKVKSSFKTLL